MPMERSECVEYLICFGPGQCLHVVVSSCEEFAAAERIACRAPTMPVRMRGMEVGLLVGPRNGTPVV